MGGWVCSRGSVACGGHELREPDERRLLAGPLTNDRTASTTQAVATAYDQVWCVTKADVQNAYFHCPSD